MGRKKVDKRVRSLISDCIFSKERSLFFVFGHEAREQIPILYYLSCKERNKNSIKQPCVLWCYKKDQGYNFICQKTQRSLMKKYSGDYSWTEDGCFEHFIASANICFCHYNDTTSILGQTFGMLIIQDFDAVTPNIIARIVECIEGGGIIIIIFPGIKRFEEISTMKLEAHSRYITSAHPEITPFFVNRLLLSLVDCKNCIVLDDNLRVLLFPGNFISVPDSNKVIGNVKLSFEKYEEKSLKVLNNILDLCCTSDQVNVLQLAIKILKETFSNTIVSLTSARGRGKSATLGLAVSCALKMKYSNICVTSPQVHNLQTFFSFVIKGMKASGYEKGCDFNILYYTSEENNKFISGLNIFHDQKQTVKYFNPGEFSKVGHADLVVIDEAAAIPLPIVKSWLNSNIVLMASTINGYEGTGRSLSLKLMNQLRKQSLENLANKDSSVSKERGFTLHECTLNEAIRYANGDHIEAWLNSLFCLNTEVPTLCEELPAPEQCQLYYVNKKVLFSYNKIAEKFLQELVGLFVSSHYKNCPNDLLMMADAPSHHIFCLLPPVDTIRNSLPNVLCVLQIALEGKIPIDCVIQELSHGKRASGDLIPWIISQQFQDDNFPSLSGARIVRIATRPECQGMGYGQRALQLLFSYYSFSQSPINIQPHEESTLLFNLNELRLEKLDYIGVSYGLTLELLKFWKKTEFVPLYLRQTASEITGEHSCIMIRVLDVKQESWLSDYASDFIERFVVLLSSAFNKLPITIALKMIHNKKNYMNIKNGCFLNLDTCNFIHPRSIKRLKAYCNHLVDYHLIMDVIHVLSRFYFLHYFKEYFLSPIQEAVLLGMCLQNKAIEEISSEISMETSQVMGIFMKITKKFLPYLENFQENGNQTSFKRKPISHKEKQKKVKH